MDGVSAEFGEQDINSEPLSVERGDPSLPVIEVGSGKAIAACLGNTGFRDRLSRPATLLPGRLPIPRGIRFRQQAENLTFYSNEPDAGHPLNQFSTVTTPENPAPLYDDFATHCSSVIAFDADGRALAYHDPAITRDDYGIAFDKYFKALPDYIGSEGVTFCVSGMSVGRNFKLTDEDIAAEVNPIDSVIGYLRDKITALYPSVNFVSFVSKQFDNQQRSSPYVPDNIEVSGFAFVPTYLSADRKNHLFPILRESGYDIRKELRIPYPLRRILGKPKPQERQS